MGAEVALSALLLVLAGLLVSSLWHVLHVDRGFAVDRALAVSPALPAQYQTTQDKAGFFDSGRRPTARSARGARGRCRQ